MFIQHYVPCVMCHMSPVSCVTCHLCHVSHVTCVMCHMSPVMCHLSHEHVFFLSHVIVTCNMSSVTCHLSRVTCHIKVFFYNYFFFFFFIRIFLASLKKIRQSGGAGRWRVCYQWGLPRLVF